MDPNDSNNNANMGLAAMGLMLLLVAIMLALWAVFSAFAALFAAPVIMIASRVMSLNSDPVKYSTAYVGAFYGTLAFAIACAATVWLFAYVLKSELINPLMVFMAMIDRSPGLQAEAAKYTMFQAQLTAAMVCIPGVIAFAGMLVKRVGGPFAGAVGFARGFLVAIPSLIVGMASAWLLMLLGAKRLQSRGLPPQSLLGGAFVLGIIAFLLAISTAVVAAIALLCIARFVYKDDEVSYSRAYGALFIGLLAYFACAALLVFLLPDTSVLLKLANLLAHVRDVAEVKPALAQVDLMACVREFLWVQVPGLLACAGVVAARLGGTFEGFPGYARACAASAVAIGVTGMGAAMVLRSV